MIDLLAGREVEKGVIIAELTDLNEMLDQSETAQENLGAYFKK